MVEQVRYGLVGTGMMGVEHLRNLQITPGAVVTALGAAVGGLVVNTVIDKWQDRREEADEKQEKWEEKWGSDDERYWGKERHYDDRDSRDRGRGGRDKRDGRGYSR